MGLSEEKTKKKQLVTKKWTLEMEVRGESLTHTDELLRAHKLLLAVNARGFRGRLVDWKTEKPVGKRRVFAYLRELEAESHMGFQGKAVAAMLRSILKVEGSSDGNEQR
jgi:hypothetical protein